MKHLLLTALALTTIAFTACEKKGDGRMDPNSKISIRAADGVPVKAESNPKHLTALEIVEQTSEVYFWSVSVNPTEPTRRGFSDGQRDYVNARLLMHSSDVIDSQGKLTLAFIEGRDCMLVIKHFAPENENYVSLDTVAYIPNSTMRAAEKAIKEAYANKDYEACYALFDQAFRFTPITGEEWRELKAKE